ncbi:universal stress protein [Allomuricauda sp. F6463D]|uniref:universal stress protein n=1 Tax=Allomuricauda sp. F6463D TaxID=2926409 RepID=UPI001FF6BDE8|nr:universal stress protein [Muricauda sp. F6463D]MCK0159247.1 universal stress protein [Muricauda sp. F6463D]
MIKVVLPTDFSENAFSAISYAVKLFEKSTCIFYLVHAYTPPVYRADYALGSPGQLGLPDTEKYKAEEALDKIRTKIKTKFNVPTHDFVIHAAFNSLEDEIASISQKENIDLVVMGTQGATGAKEILFGSNTIHVIQKTGIPVLAVPSDYEYKPPFNVLFPTDYEVDYKKANVDFLLEYCKLWRSKLHIMHVTSSDGLDSEQAAQKTDLEGMLLEQNYQFYDLPDQELISAINGFQKENPVELLAMVKNKHSFIERLFVEPIIKNIGLHAKVPFLVLPYNK